MLPRESVKNLPVRVFLFVVCDRVTVFKWEVIDVQAPVAQTATVSSRVTQLLCLAAHPGPGLWPPVFTVSDHTAFSHESRGLFLDHSQPR